MRSDFPRSQAKSGRTQICFFVCVCGYTWTYTVQEQVEVVSEVERFCFVIERWGQKERESGM